ncbi:BBE domain-containing protein, partial [Nocardia tengchongensis]
LYPVMIIGRDSDGAPQVFLAVCHLGEPESADREIAEILAIAPPFDNGVARDTYPDALRKLDELTKEQFYKSPDAPQGHFWSDRELAASPEKFGEVVAANIDRLLTDPEHNATIMLEILGKRLVNVANSPAKHRTAPGIMVSSEWEGNEMTPHWTKLSIELDKALLDGGATVDEFGLIHGVSDVTPEIVRENFGPEVYQRLAVLKAEYDPKNIFHLNYNIVPAADSH